MEKGMGCFGKQYEIAYENDVHANGSVDHVLFQEMTKLDEESADFLYAAFTDQSSGYRRGERPLLEEIALPLRALTDAGTVDNVAGFCMDIVNRCETRSKDMLFGGTEEEIIKRGTYWCTDIARVACVLLQIAGIPTRIVITANTKFAYCGHSVVEAFYDGKWGVVDPTYGIAPRFQSGEPMSARDIQRDARTANAAFYQKYPEWQERGFLFFSPAEQYESVAVANYSAMDMGKYQYETSRLNAYMAAVLKRSGEGWPGGICWIHGEEQAQ